MIIYFCFHKIITFCLFICSTSPVSFQDGALESAGSSAPCKLMFYQFSYIDRNIYNKQILN